MSVLTVTTANLSLFKRASGNPSYEWVNTYEVGLQTAPGAGGYDEIATFVQAVAAAEASIHNANIQYVRGVYSTWAADSDPYRPENFIVVDLDNVGTREILSPALPRNAVLHVKRSTQFGRSGKLFYRGALQADDLESDDSLLPILTTGALAEFEILVDAFYSAFIDAGQDLGGGTNSLVMISVLGDASISLRIVTQLVPKNVSFVSPDHRYFDI